MVGLEPHDNTSTLIKKFVQKFEKYNFSWSRLTY